MPRFYFDTHHGDCHLCDEAGVVLPDLVTAEREAAKTALGIAHDLAKRDIHHDLAMELRAEDGQPVATISVSWDIARHGPAPG